MLPKWCLATWFTCNDVDQMGVPRGLAEEKMYKQICL